MVSPRYYKLQYLSLLVNDQDSLLTFGFSLDAAGAAALLPQFA
jgi:hypothetical protein